LNTRPSTLACVSFSPHAAQQQRAHVRDGGAHRHAALAVEVPELDRTAGEGRLDPERGESFLHLGIAAARPGDAGKVALHVGHEHRHAQIGESLGERLHGDGLAGAGGAGDQPMAVGEPGQERKLDFFVLRQKHA
jgi:hypothetical protein